MLLETFQMAETTIPQRVLSLSQRELNAWVIY